MITVLAAHSLLVSHHFCTYFLTHFSSIFSYSFVHNFLLNIFSRRKMLLCVTSQINCKYFFTLFSHCLVKPFGKVSFISNRGLLLACEVELECLLWRPSSLCEYWSHLALLVIVISY